MMQQMKSGPFPKSNAVVLIHRHISNQTQLFSFIISQPHLLSDLHALMQRKSMCYNLNCVYNTNEGLQ